MNSLTNFLAMCSLFCQITCVSIPAKYHSIGSRLKNLTTNLQPKDKKYYGILVGVVTPFETTVLSFGDTSKINEKTIFEIGSVTKGFVGLALSQAVIDGKVNIDSDFAIKAKIILPKVGKNEITWTHLANHTSGLPRIPDNMNPKDPLQPYLDYDRSMLESFLASYQPKYEPGKREEYSNTGAGVVGLGLEKIYGKSLNEVFQQIITKPLKMDDTQIFLSDEQETRKTSLFFNGELVPYWQWKRTSALQGAGALKSTMTDMIKFLKAMMGLEWQPLLPAVKIATQATWSKGNSSVGLFWNRLHQENIVWHNGATYGSSSFIGFDPDKLVGIVVLSNTQVIDEKGVDPRLDIAAIETLIELRSQLVFKKSI